MGVPLADYFQIEQDTDGNENYSKEQIVELCAMM